MFQDQIDRRAQADADKKDKDSKASPAGKEEAKKEAKAGEKDDKPEAAPNFDDKQMAKALSYLRDKINQKQTKVADATKK